MPSSMIHLLTAYKYNPVAPVAFWIGNIAPDAVNEWKEKDKSHFRDRTDRLEALQELAFTMDLADDYSHGILLHLYLDYCWDSKPMHNFIESYKGENWFTEYRQEIALAGGWLFHHTEWSKRVWIEMEADSMATYKNIHRIKKEDVVNFISRNNKWHLINNVGPSSAFTPDFIEEFTSRVAISFRAWLEDKMC